MTIAELIIESAKKALNLQREEGSMPQGHNGPYNDKETPVRNTSHWLITFAKAYELTNDRIFIDAVQKAAHYLISEKARPFRYSFFHRTDSQIDSCNGLIGQAWTIEALATASNILNDSKYSNLGETVFFQHNFNDDYGLWNRLEIDGKIKSIDATFNHQLWFAACAAQLNGSRKMECYSIIKKFILNLPENLSIIEDGLIFHPLKRNKKIKDIYDKKPIKNRIRNNISKIIQSIKNNGTNPIELKNIAERKMISKSMGYHHFNMYAFALLKDKYPQNNYWKNIEFVSTTKYLMRDDYKNELENNSFGFPYNPPGFEIPYALEVFSKLKRDELLKISSYWINKQMSKCYNPQTKMMDRNTSDIFTHSARLYELTRNENLGLQISINREI